MEPAEIGVNVDATEQLKHRLETIQNIRADEAYAGRDPQEVVKALRGLASTALEGVHIDVLHRAPEMRDALELIADREVVDFETGTISQYTTTHSMPEHDNAGKPWEMDITHDRPFQTWEDQIESAVERARDALNSQAAREEQRQADQKMRGWSPDISDAVRSLDKAGEDAFINALNDGAIPARVWTNYNGVSITAFENAEGTYGFADYGVHQTQKHFSQAIREQAGSYFLVPWDGWTDSGQLQSVSVQYDRMGDRIIVSSPGKQLAAEVEYLKQDQAWSVDIYATDGSSMDEDQQVKQVHGLRSIEDVQALTEAHGIPINDFVAERIDDHRQYQEMSNAIFQIETLASNRDTAWLLKSIGISPEGEISEYDPKLWAEGISAVAEDTLNQMNEPATTSLNAEVKAGYEALRYIKHLDYERLAAEWEGGIFHLTRQDFIDKSLTLVRDVKQGAIGEQLQTLDDAFLGLASYKDDTRDPEYALREMREISIRTRPYLTDNSPLLEAPDVWEKRQAFEAVEADLKDWQKKPYERVEDAVKMAGWQIVDKPAPNVLEEDWESYREEETEPVPEEKIMQSNPYENASNAMDADHIPNFHEQIESEGEEDPLEMIRQSFNGAPFSGPPVENRQAWDALYRVLHGDIPGRPEVHWHNNIVNLIEGGQASNSADEIEDRRHEEAIDITEWRGTGATPQEIADDLASRNQQTPPEVYRNILDEGFTKEEARRIGIPVDNWEEETNTENLIDYDMGDMLDNERAVSGSGQLLNPQGRGISMDDDEEEEISTRPKRTQGYSY